MGSVIFLFRKVLWIHDEKQVHQRHKSTTNKQLRCSSSVLVLEPNAVRRTTHNLTRTCLTRQNFSVRLAPASDMQRRGQVRTPTAPSEAGARGKQELRVNSHFSSPLYSHSLLLLSSIMIPFYGSLSGHSLVFAVALHSSSSFLFSSFASLTRLSFVLACSLLTVRFAHSSRLV